MSARARPRGGRTRLGPGARRRGSARRGSRAGSPSMRAAGRRTPPVPEQRVVQREVRPVAPAPLLGAGHVLPAALRQEPVVAAGDELGAVLERDAVRRLDRRPVSRAPRSRRSGGTARRAPSRRSRSPTRRSAIGGVRPSASSTGVSPHQAVDARMAAAAVRVDRPRERHARGRRDAVERGLGADLVEAGVQRLRRVEAADHRVLAEARQRGPASSCSTVCRSQRTNICSHTVADGRRGRSARRGASSDSLAA